MTTMTTLEIPPVQTDVDPNLSRVTFIKELVGKYYGVTVTEMNSKKRPDHIAWPRQIAMMLSYETIRTASSTYVGIKFGGRDHATVLHAIKHVKERCEIEPALLNTITTFRQIIAQTFPK